MATSLGSLLKGKASKSNFRIESCTANIDQLHRDLETAQSVRAESHPGMTGQELRKLSTRLESISYNNYSSRLRLENNGFRTDYETLKFRVEGIIGDIVQAILDFIKGLFGVSSGGGGGGGGGSSVSTVGAKAVSTASVAVEKAIVDKSDSKKEQKVTIENFKNEFEYLKDVTAMIAEDYKKQKSLGKVRDHVQIDCFSFAKRPDIGNVRRDLETLLKNTANFLDDYKKGNYAEAHTYFLSPSNKILFSYFEHLDGEVYVLHEGEGRVRTEKVGSQEKKNSTIYESGLASMIAYHSDLAKGLDLTYSVTEKAERLFLDYVTQLESEDPEVAKKTKELRWVMDFIANSLKDTVKGLCTIIVEIAEVYKTFTS